MSDFSSAVGLALGLILRGDVNLYAIVRLSLEVKFCRGADRRGIRRLGGRGAGGVPLPGAAHAGRPRQSLLGLPPVVVGLAAYILLSRAGPLGSWGLLFTPTAMVIVQTVLAAPIVTAIVHRAAEEMWALYGEGLQMAGATRLETIPQLLKLSRLTLLTALLAGFGRTISEVGAIIIVGGNIAGFTRTMTTAIALQTSMGNLPLALALGLVLITISVLLNGAAFALADRRRRQ